MSLREAIVEAGDVTWRPMALHRLRGIPDRHEIFQVETSRLEADFPALHSAFD
ncbi:MAG: hypothetical protein ABIZ57_12040 [Candidatus Limnocylindria bacterium]